MSYQKLELELTSTPHLSEHIEQDMLDQKINQEKQHVEEMVTNHNKIQKIKGEIEILLQSMNNNPSYLSRAASFWNEIPLWEKITAGAVLTVPLLMIGILANLGALTMLSIIAVLGYTASSILLDNHQHHTTDTIKHLKEGVASLIELLDAVISTLEQLCDQLALEIETFQNENARLTAHIGQFGEQINTLKSEIMELIYANSALSATKIELEHTITALKDSIQEQSQILEHTQKQLKQVVQNYNDNQNQLFEKITELEDTKEQLKIEVAQSRAVALVFRGTVETFSNLAILDKEQRVAFQERLENFLTNKEKSFIEVADRICDAERKLSAVLLELVDCNQKYYALLDRQELQIVRLEHRDETPSQGVQELFHGVTPSVNGFYAVKNEPPLVPEPILGAPMIAVL